MTTNQLSLTWQEFEQQFRPERNKFSKDPNQFMYETYGEEVEWVARFDPHYVWTYLDIDNGTVIVEGYHFINRIGYFITEVPWIDSTSYEVDLELNTCEQCDEVVEFTCQEDDGELTCNNCCGHEGCQ